MAGEAGREGFGTVSALCFYMWVLSLGKIGDGQDLGYGKTLHQRRECSCGDVLARLQVLRECVKEDADYFSTLTDGTRTFGMLLKRPRRRRTSDLVLTPAHCPRETGKVWLSRQGQY